MSRDIKRSRLGRLITAVLIFAPLMAALGAARTQADSAALVRLDAADAGHVARLAALDLQILTRLRTESGEIILLEADAILQRELDRRGFAPQVIEDPANPQGYQLIYGTPEQFAAAGELRPLVVSGSQALASLDPEQVQALEALGLQVMPLQPHPLVAIDGVPLPALQAASAPDAPALVYRPVIQQMVNAVTQSTLSNRVGLLSGEQAAIVNGSPYMFYTRYTWNQDAITKATRYGHEYFTNLGLNVGYDYYYLGGAERRNVIAEMPGLTEPNRIALLTAHLDSYSTSSPSVTAPGADDNATGSAAVMTIAEILNGYVFNCTLRYALFTGEEQGLYGSRAYAGEVRAAGHEIMGVLNLDMLGYNTAGTSERIELHTRPGNAGDLAIANLFAEAVAAYGQSQLIPLILQDGKSFSDHSPFWDYGFPAILAIEDWADHTPFYHQPGDRLSTLNLPYYTRFTRAALAAFAHMGCLSEDGVLEGSVTDSNGAVSGATVAALASGSVFSAQTRNGGGYQLILPPGAYTLRFSAANHRTVEVSGVNVPEARRATLSRVLQACTTVSGVTLTPTVVKVQAGASVNFEAQAVGGGAGVGYSWKFGDGAVGSGTQVSHTYLAPGAYVVEVSADNDCAYPQRAGAVVLVEVEPTYLPWAAR